MPVNRTYNHVTLAIPRVDGISYTQLCEAVRAVVHKELAKELLNNIGAPLDVVRAAKLAYGRTPIKVIHV